MDRQTPQIHAFACAHYSLPVGQNHTSLCQNHGGVLFGEYFSGAVGQCGAIFEQFWGAE